MAEVSSAAAKEEALRAALDALVWPHRDDADVAAWHALLAGAVGELVALREEVSRLREEARELERATPQGRVLAVLEGAHVPLTLSCILRGAHTHRARTLKFLHELVAEGAVVREGAGGKGASHSSMRFRHGTRRKGNGGAMSEGNCETIKGQLGDALRQYDTATKNRIAGKGSQEEVTKASREVVKQMTGYGEAIEQERAQQPLRSF